MLEYLPEQELNKVLLFTRDLVKAQKVNPFRLLTESEFLSSIDESLAQIDLGQVQDADEAIDEISAELGI